MHLSSLHDTTRTSVSVSSGKTRILRWYTGNDITELAEFLNVTSQGLNRRLAYWIRHDKEFQASSILERKTIHHSIRIPWNRTKIHRKSHSNKKGVLDDIQTKRDMENLSPLSKSTYYRKVDQTLLSQYSYEMEYRWFESQEITIPSDYSVEKNRDALSTLFIFQTLRPMVVPTWMRFVND